MDAREVVTVRLLGPPAVQCDGRWVELPQGRAAALLYYLAFHGSWIARSDLVYLFWPDTAEAPARTTLRGVLHRMAQEPYARGLERERTRVRWSVRTDVQAFQRSLEAGRWDEAWARGRHTLLSGFALARAPEFEAWLTSERTEVWIAARRAGLAAVHAREAEGDRAGAVEVAAELHRADPLDEAVTRVHLAALARAGERAAALSAYEAFGQRLADELDGAPDDQTVHLADAIRTGSLAAHPILDHVAVRQREPPAGFAGSIPHPPTGFVGRAREVEALTASLLDDACRLLTIVGPGGIGKTRLAIEVASRMAPLLRYGTRYVDLAPIRDGPAAIAAVAAAVGVAASPDADGVRAIAEHLRVAQVLLVLDNVEHLVEAARPMIMELVARVPRLTMLMTSRARLGYHGERVFDLTGLSFEDASDGTGSDATTLFVRAAQRLRPDLAFTGDDLELVTSIGRLAGGSPLGLELAATWLRVLSVREIEAELASGHRLLDGSTGADERRHGSMRSVFDHSFRLLRPEERQGLRALAVFHDGWTWQAATAVADVPLRVQLALCDASLVRRDASNRFGWHPLIGRYAGEQAGEDPAAREAIEARHARHFLALLGQRQGTWTRHEGAVGLAEVEAETANLEAASRWAIAHGDTVRLSEAMHGFHWLIVTSARVGRFVQLVRACVERAGPGSVLQARALVCLGAAATWRGVGLVDDALVAGLRDAIVVLERHDAIADVALAHRFLGMALGQLERVDEARASWHRARLLHEALGEAEGVAMMRNNLADAAPTVEEAVAGLRAAVAYGLEHGVLFPAALSSNGLGDTLFQRHGPSPEVVVAFEQAIDLASRTGSRQVEQRGRRDLAMALSAGGDLVAAKAAIEAALARCDVAGSDYAMHDALAAHAIQAWVAWLAADPLLACRSALAVIEPSGALASVMSAPPAASMELAHVVQTRLALERNDVVAAESALAQARSWRRRIEPRARNWHDSMSEEPDAWARVRLLAVDCDLALASARALDAQGAAVQALVIASRSEQAPVGALALAMAANVLAQRGASDLARATRSFVTRFPGTPFEALRIVELPTAERTRTASVSDATHPASDAVDPRMLAAAIDAVLTQLRA
jgi:predicted ATPase/DNA-binding SARP family transcriptional activator